MSNLPNLREDVDNLLREVVGDYKNDKKKSKNLNEEDENDEEVLLSQLNHIDSYVFNSKQSMHNLISFDSLRPWMNLERETSSNDSVDDYFECISECDVRDKTCVSHCRVLLDQGGTRSVVRGFTTPYFFVCCYNQQCRLRGQIYTRLLKENHELTKVSCCRSRRINGSHHKKQYRYGYLFR